MRILSYATPEYAASQNLLDASIQKFLGANVHMAMGVDAIDPDFRAKHKDILNVVRGGGLWLWKPYVINKALKDLPQDVLLMYVDSGAYFVADPRELLPVLGSQPFMLFGAGHDIASYTKSKVLQELAGEHAAKIGACQMTNAAFILMRNCAETRSFMAKWLELCCRTELIDDISRSPEPKSFVDHRHDQSLLGILAA